MVCWRANIAWLVFSNFGSQLAISAQIFTSFCFGETHSYWNQSTVLQLCGLVFSGSKKDSMLLVAEPAQPSMAAEQGTGTIIHNYLIMLVRGWACARRFLQNLCVCACSWQAPFISQHICFVTPHLSPLRTIIWLDKSHYGPSMQLSATPLQPCRWSQGAIISFNQTEMTGVWFCVLRNPFLFYFALSAPPCFCFFCC